MNTITKVNFEGTEYQLHDSALQAQVDAIQPINNYGTTNNAADEEDITSEDDLLKFKDRTATDGMGYVILRKGKTFAEQLTHTNTIYEIRYDFDLLGASVTVPSGCVLFFNGGKISGGTLTSNNITFRGDVCLGSDIRFSSTQFATNYFSIDWFENTDDYTTILNNVIAETDVTYFAFGKKEYTFKGNNSRKNDGVRMKNNITFAGNGSVFIQDSTSCYVIFAPFLQSGELVTLSNVSIKNITFKSRETTFSQYYHLLFLESVENCTIENCNFEGWRGDAIMLGWAANYDTETIIENSVAKDIYIKNCCFDGVNRDNRQAISLGSGTNVHIDSCSFKNTTRNNMPGAIDVEPEYSASVSEIYITNCIFDAIGGATGCISFAMTLSNSLDGVYIRNNIIRNYKGNGSFLYIIGKGASSMTDFSNSNISNVYIENNLLDSSGSGIQLFMIGGCEKVSFLSNTFRGNSGDARSMIGVTLGTSTYYQASDVMVKNNTFKNILSNIAYMAPIMLYGAKNVTFESNLIDYCGFKKGSDSGTTILATQNSNVTDINVAKNIFINPVSSWQNPVYLTTLSAFADNTKVHVLYDTLVGFTLSSDFSWTRFCDYKIN